MEARLDVWVHGCGTADAGQQSDVCVRVRPPGAINMRHVQSGTVDRQASTRCCTVRYNNNLSVRTQRQRAVGRIARAIYIRFCVSICGGELILSETSDYENALLNSTSR
jgi:hypothetical protein